MAFAVVLAAVLERPLATTTAVVSCGAAVGTKNASAAASAGCAPCLWRRGIPLLSLGALSLAAAPLSRVLVPARSPVALFTLTAPTMAPIVVIVIVVAVRPLPVRWLPSTPASSFWSLPFLPRTCRCWDWRWRWQWQRC